MLFYADIYADRTIPAFDRYIIRSKDEEAAVAAVTSTMMIDFDKIDMEPAPDTAAHYLDGVPDDQIVLIEAGIEATFVGNGG